MCVNWLRRRQSWIISLFVGVAWIIQRLWGFEGLNNIEKTPGDGVRRRHCRVFREKFPRLPHYIIHSAPQRGKWITFIYVSRRSDHNSTLQTPFCKNFRLSTMADTSFFFLFWQQNPSTLTAKFKRTSAKRWKKCLGSNSNYKRFHLPVPRGRSTIIFCAGGGLIVKK